MELVADSRNTSQLRNIVLVPEHAEGLTVFAFGQLKYMGHRFTYYRPVWALFFARTTLSEKYTATWRFTFQLGPGYIRMFRWYVTTDIFSL